MKKQVAALIAVGTIGGALGAVQLVKASSPTWKADTHNLVPASELQASDDVDDMGFMRLLHEDITW